MSNNSPVFPMTQSHHFNDYGFDPQIDYFQFLEEAKKHKKENSSTIDVFHQFKLEKPMSKDDMFRTTLHKKNKKRWFWKKALLFFKWRKWPISAVRRCGSHYDGDVHMERATVFRAESGSMSGPVYVSERWTGSSTPYRNTKTLVPYLSLRELNMERQQRIAATSSSMSGPVYLVT